MGTFFHRCMKACEVSFSAGVQNLIEERHVCWTTYANLKLWFDSWKLDLLHLDFAERKEDSIHIIEDQMGRIVNLDETCLSLDGNQGNRGGGLQLYSITQRSQTQVK